MTALLYVLEAIVAAVLAGAVAWSLTHTPLLALPLVAVVVGVVVRVVWEWSIHLWIWDWHSSIRRRIEEQP